MTAIQLTTLSQIRHDIASRTPHSRRLVGIDFLLVHMKAGELREDLQFDALLKEEVRHGAP